MNETTTKILGSFKAQAAQSAVTGVKKDDVYKVPPEQLEEEPGFNERDYSDPLVVQQIEDFAFAYATGQFVPPLVVRVEATTGKKIIVEGHQRRRGALLAISRGATIPHLVCIPFRGNDRDRVMCQLSSQEGLKLSAVGVGRNYLKLIRMGMTEEEIAKERNKSLVHVRDMLVLAEATSEVQKMILAGSVGASLAVEVIREHGDQAAEFLKGKLEIAKSHGKTKVKPSLVREWIPPRKSVEQIYSSLGSLVGGLKQRADIAELIQQVGERGAQTLDGQAVSVDASTLMQLMQAFDEAEQLKAKRLRNTVESKGETDPAKGAVEQTAGEVAGA